MIQKILPKINLSKGDHTARRNSRLLFSIATSVLAKFFAIGSTLITIPLTLEYLGAESFGVWMVISGVIGFMNFSDLGVGMGLQNALSKAYGEDDHDSPKHYIANAYFLLGGITSSLVLLSVGLFYILPVENIFKIEDKKLLTEAVDALKYSLLAFLLGVPIALIQRVLGGIQKTYIANNVMLIGSIVGLCSILSSVYLDLGLISLVILFILSPTATQLIYSIYFFYKNREFRPGILSVSKKHMRPVVSAGAWVVLVQVIYTAKINVPTMIISASLGMLAVAEYSIVQKLTGLVASLISIAMQPLWVVYGEAFHRGDKTWVENTLRKSIKIIVAISIFSAISFQLLGQSLINIWLGADVLPSQMLIAAFSLWMIASNINICFAMLLNGVGNFKRPSINSFIFVSSAIFLAYIYVDDVKVSGIVFIMFLFSELCRVPFNYFEAKRMTKLITKQFPEVKAN